MATTPCGVYPLGVYVVLFVAGLSGLLVMMLVGFVHAPHVHKHAHGRGALPRGQARALPTRAGASLTAERVTLTRRTVPWLGPLLSPLTWFSWMFGAGAVGMVAVLLHASPLVVHVSAIAGALGFQLLVVRPIWKIVFRFESQPAGNLEGCLMQQVEVVTAFNARGEGLVRVTIDGRTEDILAVLRKSEQRAGEARPRRGERLLIEDVDLSNNTCVVTRV